MSDVKVKISSNYSPSVNDNDAFEWRYRSIRIRGQHGACGAGLLLPQRTRHSQDFVSRVLESSAGKTSSGTRTVSAGARPKR